MRFGDGRDGLWMVRFDGMGWDGMDGGWRGEDGEGRMGRNGRERGLWVWFQGVYCGDSW
jgi:hypothetical protein